MCFICSGLGCAEFPDCATLIEQGVDALFDQVVAKVGADESKALKKLLAPSVLEVLKKKAEGLTGEAAKELDAKIKAIGEAVELK